jgi:hypothetical protein
MKAASDLTQERLTVVEISGSDGSSYRHRDKLEVTQSIRTGRRRLGDALADRFGLNFHTELFHSARRAYNRKVSSAVPADDIPIRQIVIIFTLQE